MAYKNYKIIGKSILRTDGKDKITGKSKYIDDIFFKNIIYGGVVRSHISHGIFLDYILDSNWDWSEYTIVDSTDITGINFMSSVISDQPFLVNKGGFINYKGEACVLLAHKEKNKLIEGLRRVKLKIKPLETLLEIKNIISNKKDILKYHTITIKKGEPKSVFSNLPPTLKVIENVYTTSYQEQMYLELQGIDAWWVDNKLTIFGSLQCPYYVKDAMIKLFCLNDNQVRVVQSVTGGAFGGKEEFPSLIAGYAGLLAKKSNKRVRLVFNRKEDISFTTKRHPTISKVKSAVRRKDGKIIAILIDIFLDSGAYFTLSPVVLSRCVLHLTAPYEIENININGHLLKTNTPPNGAFRGFGAPQAFFSMESHMENIAKQINIDIIKVKKTNSLKKGSLTSTGQNLGEDVWSYEVLKKALKLSQYYDKKKEFDLFNKIHSRKKRGVGLSLVYHGSAFTGSGEKDMKAKVRIDIDKHSKVHIKSSIIDMGQGSKTIMKQIVSEMLDIDIDKIIYENPDTDIVPDSGPTVASRSTVIIGELIRKACKKALLDKDYINKSYEAQYEQPSFMYWNEKQHIGDAYPAYSYMCSVVEIEIDLTTLIPHFLSITCVVEAGQIINPRLARGQIAGGISQSIGWALIEHPIYKGGIIQNATLSKLLFPSVEDLPEFKIEFLNKNGNKSKGIGELPMNGPGVASTIALSRALNFDEINKIPFNSSEIFELLIKK